jgi:hypothetical protein
MVKSGQYKKCERAYLGEEMPLPDIPHEQEFVVRNKNFILSAFIVGSHNYCCFHQGN